MPTPADVTKADGDTGWDFECRLCGYRNTGNPTKASAMQRRRDHHDEHERVTAEPED